MTVRQAVIPTGKAEISSEAELDRVEAWMRKKHLKSVVARLEISATKSKRRGAKSALVPIGDLLDLLKELGPTS